MEKNMEFNFKYLKERVMDALNNSDLEFIRYELSRIDLPTLFSGVGGSSVVGDFGSKVLNKKNKIISINYEPRNFLYSNISNYSNVIACSYSGNNYGVELSFANNMKKYLLSNNSFSREDITYLKYTTTIEKEKSFISLGASMIPISVLMNYYIEGKTEEILPFFDEKEFNFDVYSDIYEIFSGYDTSSSSKYLESTMIESGIGIPIVHDKYSFCHGRSTFGINYDSIAIYYNRNTEFDKLMLEELQNYYKTIVVIESRVEDDLIDDYQMLIQSMYLTRYIALSKKKDLSGVDYSPIVKKLYKYNGQI